MNKTWPISRWLILAAALGSMLLTVSLGAWQLRRAAYKTTLSEAIEKQKSLPAAESIAQLAIKNIANPYSQAIHRSVALRGRWLHEYTVFLDNRPMQIQGSQRVGFFVATPFALKDGGAIVWVQRGWVARNFQDRTKLPVLAQDPGEVVLSGRVVERVSQAFTVEASQEAQTTSPTTLSPTSPLRIWQNLPVWQLPSTPLPIAVLETENQLQDSLVRTWPAADMGVAKHYGYAFQWFALSALILILYVWFQLIAPARREDKAS